MGFINSLNKRNPRRFAVTQSLMKNQQLEWAKKKNLAKSRKSLQNRLCRVFLHTLQDVPHHTYQSLNNV